MTDTDDDAAAQPRLLWDLKAELGEGPLWDQRDNGLWFTDIKRRKIYRFDPASNEKREWDSPEQVGFVVPAQSGGFVAGLQSGLHRFDPATGEFALLAPVEPDRPTNRLNDAVVDRFGRLWFGTMDDGQRDRSGAFYCFFRGELREAGIGGIAITNGPAVSPDGSTLYWVDTVEGLVSASPIREDGTLAEARPFVAFDGAQGHPDGPSVDAEGHVWIALYGGWEARRYSPTGELSARVRFPVANITKIAFGGPGLRTGFATTARQLLGDESLARQPLAGALFAFAAPAPGIGSPAVADGQEADGWR